jgi:hypothetical protein
MPALAGAHARSRNLPTAAIGSAKPETYMKLLSTLTVAALLTAGSAFAASTSPTPTATPASSATPAAKKHTGSMHCEREAKAKKLTGDDATKFVKECKEGKKN